MRFFAAGLFMIAFTAIVKFFEESPYLWAILPTAMCVGIVLVRNKLYPDCKILNLWCGLFLATFWFCGLAFLLHEAKEKLEQERYFRIKILGDVPGTRSILCP